MFKISAERKCKHLFHNECPCIGWDIHTCKRSHSQSNSVHFCTFHRSGKGWTGRGCYLNKVKNSQNRQGTRTAGQVPLPRRNTLTSQVYTLLNNGYNLILSLCPASPVTTLFATSKHGVLAAVQKSDANPKKKLCLA